MRVLFDFFINICALGLVKECSVVACASFLCFCVGLCAAQESSVKEPVLQNPIETVQQKEVLIKVTAGNREFRVALNSTPEAKLFYSQLPLSVSMGRFGGREFYGSMPGKMKVSSEGQYTFKDGTLTYCPTNTLWPFSMRRPRAEFNDGV